MHDSTKNLKNVLDLTTFSGSGHDIIRYVCLPDLLGKDSSSILYLMGKNLARKSSFKTTEEIIEFFHTAGWGDLILQKEKRGEIILELTGNAISDRIKSNIDHEYRLESGFLAEAIQQMKDLPCECVEEIKRRKQLVQFDIIYTK